MMEPKKIGVLLSTALTYSSAGEFKETGELEFACPTMASYDEAVDLSQMVMNSLMDAGKNAPKDVEAEQDSSAKMDAEAVKIVLMTAERIKVKDVAKCFRKLALQCGTFDGKEPLTASTFEKIEMEDFTKCMCEYIANFIVPSLLLVREGGSEQKGSGTA